MTCVNLHGVVIHGVCSIVTHDGRVAGLKVLPSGRGRWGAIERVHALLVGAGSRGNGKPPTFKLRRFIMANLLSHALNTIIKVNLLTRL